MRIFIAFVFLLNSLGVSSQMTAGFNANEAVTAIAFCNSFNFKEQFQSNKAIIPEGFQLRHTSDIMSMDNKFEVYQNDSIGIINYRGSTAKLISWIENCYSAMIPASGSMMLNEETYNYKFAEAEKAAVHAGYALTVVIISEDLIEQIKALNQSGIYHIIITGHSQGGALATLTRAYLENLPAGVLPENNRYKTYAFAQPMSGNKEFAEEYDTRFSETGTSFSVINPKDPVPYMPFNYEEAQLVTKEKVVSWLLGTREFKPKKLGQDAFIRLFEGGLTGYINNSNALINKILDFKFGSIAMPEIVADINYYPTGERKELPKFDYPKIEVDVTGFTEEELGDLVQDENGRWYKKETKFFQHKPYNYYVGVLKKWQYNKYSNLELKYLPADL
ncbi:lipase family protein [Tamlana haliotis]|uniref:Lipase family protein n=1 Tax=Pseudotamlana haliotis TaxID=2614804 RepID=A0A6N6MEE2_9FLAO|nr:lipase family protein [Tamlana haliotis]KAB1068098.1 lipase family protein [Tamlana haliotis]